MVWKLVVTGSTQDSCGEVDSTGGVQELKSERVQLRTLLPGEDQGLAGATFLLIGQGRFAPAVEPSQDGSGTEVGSAAN